MKNIVVLISLLPMLFLVSCSGTGKSQKTAEKQVELKPVIIEQGHPTSETQAYSIKSFSIEGDVLTIYVSYKGGCGKHDFNLYSNGLLMKSLPPQINVFLEQKVENESCSNEINQTLKFDLTPIKKPGNAKIILNINTHENKAEWLIQ